MIGDMPPPPPPLLGWRWPRGPFIMPVRISASPMFASFGRCLELASSSATKMSPIRALQSRSAGAVSAADALRPTTRRRRVRLSGHARIPNDAMDHEPVPDEQHDERAERRGDETGALIGPVPADGLADKGGDEGPGDSQRSGKDEAFRLVRTRRNHARNQAGNEADDDDPDDVPHDDLPRLRLDDRALIRRRALKAVPR